VRYPAGKVVTIERTLASQGWLPNRPGVYTVVVTWCPLDRTHFEPGPELPRKDDIKVYAAVQATATFRTLAEPSPPPTRSLNCCLISGQAEGYRFVRRIANDKRISSVLDFLTRCRLERSRTVELDTFRLADDSLRTSLRSPQRRL